MKFVFLPSGDYLEFTPKNTTFVNAWFDYLFEEGMEKNFVNKKNEGSTNTCELRMAQLNHHIDIVNEYLKVNFPDTIRFDNSLNLNQSWLNSTHKIWVKLMNQYSTLYTPDLENSWEQINHLIHMLESNYQQTFENVVEIKIPEHLNFKIEKEDCEFSQHDLVLAYNNLGRHQFNQWQVGLDQIDDETNNYKDISTTFEYFQGTDKVSRANAPIEYIAWCNRQNIEVLAPWVVLGTFNIDTWQVKEIMHRNLQNLNLLVGFER